MVTAVKSTSKGDAKAATPKAPKLTPDQILANQTLESAESQARGLEAPMRSYSLLQIAEAFTVSDPAKARGLLARCLLRLTQRSGRSFRQGKPATGYISRRSFQSPSLT